MVLIWPTLSEAIAHSSHTAKAPLTWDPASHLLSRLTFGATPADRAWIAKNGVDAWYLAQVAAARPTAAIWATRASRRRGRC